MDGSGLDVEVARLHEAIHAASNPMVVLDRVVHEAVALLPAADGASLEIRRDADTLEYVAAAGTLAQFVGIQVPVRASLSGLAVRTGQVQWCDDGLDDPRVNAEAVRTTGVRSMLCIPLSPAPGDIAVLKISSREPHAFVETDVDRVSLLVTFLGETITAASRLADVTASILDQLDNTRVALAALDGGLESAARFVANVMQPGLAERIEERRYVEQILEDESVEIVFQPIVRIATGVPVACEALSRFPAVPGQTPDWWFIAAHDVGLGVELEFLAVRKVLAELDRVPPQLRVGINVGAHAVLDPRFTSLFDGVPRERVTLELTEHEAVADYVAIREAIAGLRAEGMRVSVDDTGTGYSSLSHVLQLQPDEIKLDRELVTGVDDDPAKKAMATSLVTFASAIEASVIAEGIEHESELACLRTLGVHLAQGYYFGRPGRVDQLPGG